MSYKVQYSAEARQDLKDIFNYIAQELLVPDTAKNQTRRIMYGGRDISKQLEENE